MLTLIPPLALTAAALPTRVPADVFAAASAGYKRFTCPIDISAGRFEFPHLIVPTSSQEPDKAFGTSYDATISPVITTLFNFDIPANYNGTCAVLFQFPYASDTAPSAGKYEFSGFEEEIGENGGINFALLQREANESTTWASTPPININFGKTQIVPGNNYTVATLPCPSGRRITFSASSVGNITLIYMEDYAPLAIGLYVVPCA